MKPRRQFVFATFATLHLALCFPVTRSFAADGAVEAFFESKIRPLLAERCYACHGEKKQKGGLRLDSKGGWQKGGESGPALVPGKPQSSLLIKAVSSETDDFGNAVAANPIDIHDVHATILHQKGLDHTRLTFRHGGRDHRLTEVHRHVVNKILA